MIKAISPADLDVSIFAKAAELKKRILFTILALIVYRVGSYVPIPGINSQILEQVAAQNAGGILGMFNMLSGGSLGRMTIFALSIVPYITSSIIMQLMTLIFKPLENLKKDSEAGRKKISQYTRYLTVILCSFQAFGVAVGLENMSTGQGINVTDGGTFFRIVTVFTLVSGTMFLMWLGDQITSRGLGNGISLIIFAGIVSGLPMAIAKSFELARVGAINPLFIVFILALAALMVAAIVFFEKAQRKILIQYPKRQVGNKVYGGDNSYLPLKLNTAGVIPPIFAASILSFPATIATFSNKMNSDSILNEILNFLNRGKPFYYLLYIGLITFFCFFYTAVVFNPKETADNLKKYNGFIPGRRPGNDTANYLDYIITRLTVIGAIYITSICIIPEVLMSKFSVPFYLGGTSLLIVVNVVIDTMVQIQTHLFAHQYENLIKKSKLRDRKV